MDIQEFFNPKAMLTPGLSGGLIMAMALPLAHHFQLSYLWLAISLSFLLAILIDQQICRTCKPAWLERSVYCLFNTLIIFSMAVGSGKALNPPPAPQKIEPPPILSTLLKEALPATPAVPPGPGSFRLDFWQPGAVWAQPARAPATPKSPEHRAITRPGTSPPPSHRQTGQTISLTPEQQKQIQDYLEQQRKQQQKQKSYYKTWSW